MPRDRVLEKVPTRPKTNKLFSLTHLLVHHAMAFISPDILRVILLGVLISLHTSWRHLLNTLVPQPYLDEVFHIPQAQAFWEGRWNEWNAKITTPPGVYLFSYVFNCVMGWLSESQQMGVAELRFSNSMLLYILLVGLYVWTAVTKRAVHHEAILQREFAIVVFPLMFFFSGLYYTDLFSVVTVLITYVSWAASSQARGGSKVVHQTFYLLSGLVSLSARQTNVFWVAVYLGGLQVVKSVKREAGLTGIHDPPISEAFFEGQTLEILCDCTDWSRLFDIIHLNCSTSSQHLAQSCGRSLAIAGPPCFIYSLRPVEWRSGAWYESHVLV